METLVQVNFYSITLFLYEAKRKCFNCSEVTVPKHYQKNIIPLIFKEIGRKWRKKATNIKRVYK